MSKGRRREEVGSNLRSSRIMTRSMRLKNEVERLLPDIPDEIILDQIVPKLPWGTLHILSSVNRRWRQAMQSREIYNARVPSHSTETLVVINHTVIREGEAVSLYSVRGNSCYQLPQFPKSQNCQGAVSTAFHSYRCISLDGKIYVLGGLKEYPKIDDGDPRVCIEACSEVYVLDLAGRRKWMQCASMPQPRFEFGCGVLDGKIYVLKGRTSGGKYVVKSVVYDPTENAWSLIKSMRTMKSNPHVLAIGEKLFVQGGQRHRPGHSLIFYGVGISDIYDSGNDEWGVKVCRPLIGRCYHERERLFMAQGKLHMMAAIAIYRCSFDSDWSGSWTLLHTFRKVSFADLHPESCDVCAIQVVNGELLALTWSNERAGLTVLLQSKGFGSEKKEILWERVPSRILEKQRFPRFLCSIEL